MSVPPPPPPPPAAPQALIPAPTNKNLLASIEKGTKLKKVPEAAKNDRSSATVATGAGSSNNSNTGRRVSQSNGGTTLSKPALNNSAMDFQSQLRNQLMTMHSGSNGTQEKKPTPTVTYPSVRPALNQPLNKSVAPNYTSASINKPFTKQLSSGNFPMSNNTTCYTQQNQFSQVNNRAPPSPGVTNKPQIAKTPQSALLANKPAPMIPNATASRPQSYHPQGSNNRPPPNMFNTTNNRPLSSSQDLAIKNKAPIPNQFQVTNNRALASSNPQPSNIKAPAPNQPQFANTRAPPPPPSKTKPLQRNSISMNPKPSFHNFPGEHIRPISSAATSYENIIRQRPLSQAPSVDTNSRRSSIVVRTTTNPPWPVPGSLRPHITHNTPMPPAPHLLSRVTTQRLPVNQSTSQPYKMADRAPPPPPPGGNRASVTSFYSNFDSRFTFPNVNQFPNM